MVWENYIKSNDANRKIINEMERKKCKEIIQKEKRSFLNKILKEAKTDHSQKQYKEFLQNYQAI